MKKPNIFFRNDDPDTFEFGDKRPELKELTDLFFDNGVPLIQAVVPKTVTDETVRYFLELKEKKENLIEIVQHGYSHQKYVRGEFCSTRNYEQQYKDMENGKILMEKKFGSYFFPAFVFPFGIYTHQSLEIVERLGYKVFSCFWKNTRKHRLTYYLCHMLKVGPLLKYHISYHGRRYKNYKFVELSNCVNVIKSYIPIEYYAAEKMYERILEASKYTNLVGVVLHYNTLDKQNGSENLRKIRNLLTLLKMKEGFKFRTLEDYYNEWRTIQNG